MSHDNVNGKVSGDLISRAEAIDIVRSMTISLGGKEIFHPEAKKSVMSALDELPFVDAVPVVRCKDCANRGRAFRCPPMYFGFEPHDDWYCAEGVKNE